MKIELKGAGTEDSHSGPNVARMTSEAIQVWKFQAAPEHLRKLYRDPDKPQWVIEVPVTLHDDEIRSLLAPWDSYTIEGYVVYFGTGFERSDALEKTDPSLNRVGNSRR